MKVFLLLLTILLININSQEKKLVLNKIDTRIIIDGSIDDVWSLADSVSDFVQHQPYHNYESSRKTIAKVLTTDESLYCIMICFDDIKDVEIRTGKQDEFAGDIVSFMIDTFNDKKTGYKFAVSASGVKSDSRLLDDGRNRDYNWDGIWFAESKTYDWGFVVEMEIPYKSIQYEEELNTWGLDFDRWIPHLNEDIYWIPYEESEGQRISKFGQLVFKDFKPTVKGMNLEVYPVGLAKAVYEGNNEYKVTANAGLDIFYNPSPKLTLQFTANPDFAQIEADPFSFNISRYESYFSERRPFFTEGNEIFMPSGRDRSSGFYRPIELFYSRRIGKLLPDGSEVPLIVGTKAFGRLDNWEYGGFISRTGEKEYEDDGNKYIEPAATFGSARIKKQIWGNSTIGMLYVGKFSNGNHNGVLDIDGAIRESNWQIAYQFAGSFNNESNGFAASLGFNKFHDDYIVLSRVRHIGKGFDADEIGFVPWKGTTESTVLAGPRWFYENGILRQLLIYAGPSLYNELEDNYTDVSGVFGFNMGFRDNWGYEVTLSYGKSKDSGIYYDGYNINFSSWFNINPSWNGNLYAGYEKTYNFARDYLGYFSWLGASYNHQIFETVRAGTSFDMYLEINPNKNIEDITYNARPFVSITPINDLNMRIYVDNVFVKSTDRMERIILGFLFSYNFLPKSWIYFAYNEIQDRSDEYSSSGNLLPNRMHLVNRAGVFKVKYLYYF